MDPHLAVMYGKYNLLYKMDGINHYFFQKKDVPYKFQPGNFNFELTYSLLGIAEYYQDFYKHHFPKQHTSDIRERTSRNFEMIAQYEEEVSKPLLDYLRSHEKIRIIGHPFADRSKRVPTISFVHEDLKSDQIVGQVDDHRIGIRFGDFYAKKLIKDAGLEEKNGVVRVSLVHYNTRQEVAKLLSILEKILA